MEQSLVELWRGMGQSFVVFELWKGDEIIAADFMHLDTRTRHCYVATRCYHAKFKALGAGFLLGLISLKLLQSNGFDIYDLGGFDSSPMMSYKKELTHIQDRCTFLASFSRHTQLASERDASCPDHAKGFEDGLLISNVTTEHLFTV